MKILGRTDSATPHRRDDAYICIVSHAEMQKIANLAYGSDQYRAVGKLEAGDEYPIAEGHDFWADIQKATKDMRQAHASFGAASEGMAALAKLIQPREMEQGQ